MQITIHDNQMNRVGFLSNEVPGLPSFFNDNWHRYLAEGAATFDFSVNKFKNGALQDYCQFLNDQAYISFTYEGEDFLFSVLTSEETDDVITLNTATLNLELRNEQANPLVNSSSHNIKWYFDQMQLISNAQITIGINEVSNLTRTISYDGQESKLARLLSVIGNFDAEFEFVTDLNDDGTLKGISLNIYKANDGTSVQGVGTWRNDVTLYFGKNISGVRRTIDRTQIFNATTVTGAEGLNWNSSEWSVKNADGVEEFYKRKGSNTAFAPLSAELYPSQIKSSTGDFWIRKDFETEYKSANEMWGYALSQFKKYAYALVTYEVSAKSKLVSQAVGDGQALSIGDTVRIQDENFNAQTGGLILQARVSELEISFSNPSNNKLTFSNYVELESGISDDLEARLAQLIKDSTPYRPDITSTNGTQFKNGTGTTTLGAHIYFGSDTTETIADSYEWSKDGTVVANAQTITVDASGVADKAVYSFKATVGGKVVGSQSVTITNVNDGAKGAQGLQGPQGPQGLKGDPGSTGIPGQAGADGKTSYLHIAYATNSTGTAGFDVSNATGKTYIGQYTDFTSADSTDPSKYTWSLIKGDKGDTGPQGPQGERGIAGATGATGSLGPKGADGRSSYIHIKYAPVINPTDSQITDTPNAYIGVYTDYNQADSTSASAYTWSKWQGEDGANGVAGAKGADGRTTYVHFAYANSTNGQTNFSTSYFDGALYMGTLTDYTQTDSTNYAAYTWSRLKGDKGDKGDQGAQGIQGLQGPTGNQGVAGPKGADGKTQYTHIAYANIEFLCKERSNFTLSEVSIVRYGSDSRWVYKEFQAGTYTAITTLWGSDPASGTTKNVELIDNFSTSNSTDTTHIGVYVDFAESDSVDPSKYNWTLVKGADGTQGTPGKPGADGKTPYFHTAWSNSADGTDRFTTVYPNLNLGDNTKTFAGADGAANNITGSIRLDPATQKTQDGDFYYLTFKPTRDNFDWFRFFLVPDSATPNMTKVTVKPNTKYTFSVLLKGTGQHTIYAYQNWTAPNTPWSLQVNLTSDWKLYTFTVTSNAVIPNNLVQFFIRSNNGTEINLKKPKVEEGSIVTPWMPSSSEVTTADWPSYIGQYTDFTQADSTNPSNYTWSLIRGNDGADGQDGKNGTNGKDGDPGKVVSDTEPTTRFKGLTWKYLGTSDLTASDGTVILSGTEYYWSGTNWILSEINAHNINGNNLTITDGEFVSTTTNGQVSISTEIKDNHIIISKTDGTVNARNDIALDSEQGLAQKFTNINTGFYRLAGINFQGPFISDSDGNYAQLTPRGTDLSTDVPWTNLTLASGFSIGSGGKARYRVKNGVLYIHFRKIVCPAITGNQPNTLCYVPANGRASDGYDSFGVMSATNSTRIQYNDSGDGKVAIVTASNTTAGQGFNGFLICPID